MASARIQDTSVSRVRRRRQHTLQATESTNRDEGAEYNVRCLACQNNTQHHVVLSLARRSEDADWCCIENYQIIQCRGCGSPTFRYERLDPNCGSIHEETGQQYPQSEVVLYPPRETKSQVENACFLPSAVQSIYREVLRVLVASTPVLAAIGLRTLIEVACRDLGVTGNLKGMIDDLVADGRLRAEEAEVLHQLRDAGNASAHETRVFTQAELIQALRMVEHILTTVYLLPHHRSDLPSKKA
jgi:Domain of unknown function (DUF4145)